MKLLYKTPAFLYYILVISTMISCQKSPENFKQEIDMTKDWELFSSANLKESGKTISSSGFNTDKSYKTEVPATVMAALLKNKVYEDIFYGDNLNKISKEPFLVPWWYRKTFQIDTKTSADYYKLVLEGLNYKANIWLNGTQIGVVDSVEGCFRMFKFNITDHVQPGSNTLAVEIFPPKWGDLTIGFVDWNPWPPDNNMGIWRPVKLLKTGPVSMKNVFVKPSINVEILQEATLSISAELVNHSNKKISGKINVQIEDISINQEFSINPLETRKIEFSSSEYSELNLKNPKLWWPVNLGEPNLYNLNITTLIHRDVSDEQSIRFGIRDVKEYINENGHRGFMINGKKTLIKGAGWVDDIFLDDPDQKVEDQIRYVKHMNLNTIRLEGFWGRNQKLFDYADENGIMIMIGWSCQWEWEGYCGRPEDEYLAIRTPKEIKEHSRAYQDQVEWLRNHPSIFLWVYGSDKLLVPDLERKMNEILNLKDSTRPILNSCGSRVSEITGKSGVKMNGPYSYVTPNYWYVDDQRGGAFGFNTETGPGIQPSPIESVKKMIPPDHLWPIDSIWEYHLGRNEFRTFRHWINPFNQRYGKATGVEDFTYKAQMANYEAMRAMFEAFEVNKPNTTGLIQWMLNSAWPGMLWQLYDWYLMPNGAFYGAKNSCRPLNIIYNYKDNDIYLSNDYHTSFEDLFAEIRVLDIKSTEIFTKTEEVSIGENESIKILDMPEIAGLSTTYFIDLKLKNSEGKMISTNFYWLSTKEDILDFENSEWFITPNKSYADLTGINDLEKIEIYTDPHFSEHGDTLTVKTSIENRSDKLAFFIELSVMGKKTGQMILPVFWEDNYISLLPGEERIISGYVFKKDLGDQEPVFSFKGSNVKSH